MELGRYGIWTSLAAIGEENGTTAAKLVERLGYGTFWLGGSPRLSSIRPLLEATKRIVVATGVVNVWRYEPEQLAMEYAELIADHPKRVLVGIGIGHPEATSTYEQPLTMMRAFLDGLDNADPTLPSDARCLAALGPRMVELSAERSLGAHTYFVPAAHTRLARERLGDDALLAPEVACVLDPDPGSARAQARSYAERYLALRNYTRNLLSVGFTNQDIADGGSDRMLDRVIPHGSAEQIAAAVRQHIDCGADHVCVQPLGADGIPRAEWTELAAALGLKARRR